MRIILFIIVLSQFFCTTMWFAGNSVVADIAMDLHLKPSFLAHMTSMIQFGFIVGTLVFAVLAISDRYSPSIVFFISALIAGICNASVCIEGVDATGILLFRFLTGFFLAGIYPVGMKIASDYFQEGLGKSLGWLVGAFVMGTAFPHLLKDVIEDLPWKYVMFATSILAVIGGTSILVFVPNGPHRKVGQALKFTAFLNGFKNSNFRSAAFGYFGHMWEVYAFWAFVPVMIATYKQYYPSHTLNVSLLSFLIIASGALACALGGMISQKYGAKAVATFSLAVTCCCCLVSPIFLLTESTVLFVSFLFLWGIFVAADSPMFSTLVANHAPVESRGTSLTIVNCIGFSITIVSIQLVNVFSKLITPQFLYVMLAVGPLLGLKAIIKSK